MNVIAREGFELVYLEAELQHFSHYATLAIALCKTSQVQNDLKWKSIGNAISHFFIKLQWIRHLTLNWYNNNFIFISRIEFQELSTSHY